MSETLVPIDEQNAKILNKKRRACITDIMILTAVICGLYFLEMETYKPPFYILGLISMILKTRRFIHISQDIQSRNMLVKSGIMTEKKYKGASIGHGLSFRIDNEQYATTKENTDKLGNPGDKITIDIAPRSRIVLSIRNDG